MRCVRVLAACVVLFACSGHGLEWDAAALQREAPALDSAALRTLAGTKPYFLPYRGVLYAFLCRFSTREPITLAISATAKPAERRLVEAVLRAWEAAGLGLRFQEAPLHQAAFVIEWEERAVPTGEGMGLAHSVTDCRLTLPEHELAAGKTLAAELVTARVKLARRRADGGEPPLSPSELAGAALREVGRALGVHGSPRAKDDVLAASDVSLAEVGSGLLAGESLNASALRALYALPAGLILAHDPIGSEYTQLVDRMDNVARRNKIEGPILRVVDGARRVFWRSRNGAEYGLQVVERRRNLFGRAGAPIVVLPEGRTRSVLPRSRDLQ